MNKRLLIVGVAAALAALAAPVVHADAPADPWTPRPATYAVFVQKDVAITMSDGAILYADIHFPAVNVPGQTPAEKAPGEFPVLITQTPYNKNAQGATNDYLVQRGYVDMIVDIRGTGSSQGTFTQSFSADSQRDGKELVDWAAAQPWSTGSVGLHGASYLGITQLLTAARSDISPALKAIFPVVPTGDNFRSNFPGGYLTSLFVFAIENAADGAVPPNYTTSDPQRAARTLGSRPSGLLLQGSYSAGALSGDEMTYDGPYYQNMSALSKIDDLKTPTFIAGGWYDALSQRDGPMLFHELQARGVPVKLLMGPWYHTTAGKGLPADGIATLNELQLRWFDHYVRGDADDSLATLGPVLYERLGEGHFHTAPTWPVPGIAYSHAYLGAGGTLGGTLSAGSDVLPWHPASGACTRSTYIGTFGLAPPTPCEGDDSLNDRTGLTYDMPLDQDLDLTGPISAHLYVSTSRTDAFVTLHLEDVDPATGTASEITSGWDSLVFRELHDSRSTIVGGDYVIPYHPYTKASAASQNIQPDQVYDWWVEIRPVAVRIPEGHVLRVSIQTADTVRFLPTAARLQGSVGSVLTVYHDADHPSMVVLPTTTQ